MRACRVREGEKDGERSDHQREDILEKVKAFEKKLKYFFTQRRPTIKIQRMHSLYVLLIQYQRMHFVSQILLF